MNKLLNNLLGMYKQAKLNKKAEEDLIEVGWGLYTNDEYEIKDNALYGDDKPQEVNETFWNKINNEIDKVESWFLKEGYKKFFTKVRDEGHGKDSELGGTAWMTENQLKDFMANAEQWDTEFVLAESSGTLDFGNIPVDYNEALSFKLKIYVDDKDLDELGIESKKVSKNKKLSSQKTRKSLHKKAISGFSADVMEINERKLDEIRNTAKDMGDEIWARINENIVKIIAYGYENGKLKIVYREPYYGKEEIEEMYENADEVSLADFETLELQREELEIITSKGKRLTKKAGWKVLTPKDLTEEVKDEFLKDSIKEYVGHVKGEDFYFVKGIKEKEDDQFSYDWEEGMFGEWRTNVKGEKSYSLTDLGTDWDYIYLIKEDKLYKMPNRESLTDFGVVSSKRVKLRKKANEELNKEYKLLENGLPTFKFNKKIIDFLDSINKKFDKFCVKIYGKIVCFNEIKDKKLITDKGEEFDYRDFDAGLLLKIYNKLNNSKESSKAKTMRKRAKSYKEYIWHFNDIMQDALFDNKGDFAKAVEYLLTFASSEYDKARFPREEVYKLVKEYIDDTVKFQEMINHPIKEEYIVKAKELLNKYKVENKIANSIKTLHKKAETFDVAEEFAKKIVEDNKHDFSGHTDMAKLENNAYSMFLMDNASIKEILDEAKKIVSELDNDKDKNLEDADLYFGMKDRALLAEKVLEEKTKQEKQSSKAKLVRKQAKNKEIVVTYEGTNGKEYIVKAPNGLYFNEYVDTDTQHSRGAGPFETLEKAKEMFKKHRPSAKEIIVAKKKADKECGIYEIKIEPSTIKIQKGKEEYNFEVNVKGGTYSFYDGEEKEIAGGKIYGDIIRDVYKNPAGSFESAIGQETPDKVVAKINGFDLQGNCKEQGNKLIMEVLSDDENLCYISNGYILVRVQKAILDLPGTKKQATIKHENGVYNVYSESGKCLGKGYKTKEEAEKRLKQVEYFKHKKASKEDTYEEWGISGDDIDEWFENYTKAKIFFEKNKKDVKQFFHKVYDISGDEPEEIQVDVLYDRDRNINKVNFKTQQNKRTSLKQVVISKMAEDLKDIPDSVKKNILSDLVYVILTGKGSFAYKTVAKKLETIIKELGYGDKLKANEDGSLPTNEIVELISKEPKAMELAGKFANITRAFKK